LEQRVDPSVFNAVIATIRENVRTNLNSTVHSVEGQLQAKTAAIAACAADHGFHSGTSLPAEYNAAEQAYNDAVGALASSKQDRDTKCSVKDTTCGQRDNEGLTLYNSVVGSNQCSLPEQPAEGTVYDETFVLHNVDDWVETIRLQHTQWSSSKDSCGQQTATCATAGAAVAANETAKAEECSDLEAAKVAGQSAYDGCYNTAKGELDGYNWQALVTEQKSSVEQVETLICYIKVAVKDIKVLRKDGAIACSVTGAQYQEIYECTCTSDDGEEYRETYDVGVTVPAAPAKDVAWDTKGCAVAQAASSSNWHLGELGQNCDTVCSGRGACQAEGRKMLDSAEKMNWFLSSLGAAAPTCTVADPGANQLMNVPMWWENTCFYWNSGNNAACDLQLPVTERQMCCCASSSSECAVTEPTAGR